MSEAESWHNTECPSDLDLSRFSTGRLDHETFEQVSNHVISCDRCAIRLNTVETSDSVVAELQRCMVQDALPQLRWSIGQSVGDLELISEVGRGGMGVVYKAKQRGLKRMVAVKTITGQILDDREAKQRFKLEAEAIGRLQHPNIVQVYSFGEVDGKPFLVMEFVEGVNLQTAIRASAWSNQRIAATMRSVTEAVSFSHSRKVLHRDLKPSNVLVGKDCVKLTDFGLARLTDFEPMHSLVNDIAGTASYMAPEQAVHNGKIDETTDIYGLGAILYEMLTGRAPFRGETRPETLQLVQHGRVVPPRAIQPTADRGLEAICLKCLEKATPDRYQSADQLLEELNRWELGRPVRALSTAGRIAHPRSLRRIALAVASVALALLIAIFSYYRSSTYIVKDLRNQLSAGQPIELLADSGHPRNEFIPLGGSLGSREAAGSGVYAVSTWDYCLVELLPDPGVPEYTFAAKVKHTQSAVSGEVGLYVGRHGEGRTPNEHAFVQLSFNDIRSHQEIMARLPFTSPASQSPPNVVSVIPHVLRRQQDGTMSDLRAAGVSGPLFTPSGYLGGPWRHLAIRVSPSGFKATWDGQPIPILPIDEATQAIRQFSSGRDPELRHSGIGLYINKGAASFCDVSVTPH